MAGHSKHWKKPIRVELEGHRKRLGKEVGRAILIDQGMWLARVTPRDSWGALLWPWWWPLLEPLALLTLHLCLPLTTGLPLDSSPNTIFNNLRIIANGSTMWSLGSSTPPAPSLLWSVDPFCGRLSATHLVAFRVLNRLDPWAIPEQNRLRAGNPPLESWVWATHYLGNPRYPIQRVTKIIVIVKLLEN